MLSVPTALAVGLVQTPGAVTTAAKDGLAVVPSKSHRHLVWILWAGPVCAYTGNVGEHAPPFTEYCKVDPTGHGVPVGAVMLPPFTVHPVAHVLFIIVTLVGVALRSGQAAHKQLTVTGVPKTQSVNIGEGKIRALGDISKFNETLILHG